MGYETIKFEKRGHTAVIIMNRPHRLNAMNLQMVRELRQAIDDIEQDHDIRVFIITGAPRPDGRPCFSAGADLKEIAQASPTQEGMVLANKIEGMLKPSIAAIDGVCTAGGIELAEVCDLRVAADTAEISDLHLKNLGVGLGGWGASTRLPQIVGIAKAKELILTGMVLDGNEAHRIGLVNRVVPSSKLIEEALKLAEEIGRMNPDGVRVTLAHIKSSMFMQTHEAINWAGLITGYMAPSRGDSPER